MAIFGWTDFTNSNDEDDRYFAVQSWSLFPRDETRPSNYFTQNGYQIEEMIFKKPKRTPPLGYKCHLCSSSEHYIQDCSMGKNDSFSTPYQGNKRSCGGYVCPKCKRKWLSFNSYANMKQCCVKCRVDVYASKQFGLKELKRICEKVAYNSFEISHEEKAVFNYLNSFVKYDNVNYLLSKVQNYLNFPTKQ